METRDGERLLVSDRGDTAKYLERGDHAHRPLDSTAIREICEGCGAELVDVEDMWPHITVDTSTVNSVATAIEAVARAMDRAIEAALIIRG